MRRPSPAPLDILPTDPHRGAGTFRRGLHPRPPVRPWQHHTLNCTTPHSFHPNNPNVHVPWPLHTVGHFYMSGQAPPFVVATGGDFKLTLFTTVAQAQEHMATICRKSHAPSWLGLKPRFQHSLLVGHGQPHLKRHTPLPWTGCHAPQPCELRPLGLIPDPLPAACRLQQPGVASSSPDGGVAQNDSIWQDDGPCPLDVVGSCNKRGRNTKL